MQRMNILYLLWECKIIFASRLQPKTSNISPYCKIARMLYHIYDETKDYSYITQSEHVFKYKFQRDVDG